MNDSKITEEMSVKNILGSFIDSYAERDGSIGFSEWLERKLRQELPDMPEEACRKLAGEIIEAVSDYDETLDRLNSAVDAGQSKEEWFAEHLAEAYADMPADAVGEKLQEIEDSAMASNRSLMQGIGEIYVGDADTADANSPNWNEYSIKNKMYKIGKQAVLFGMAAAANVAKDRMQNEGAFDIGSIAREMLQDGGIKDSGEAKAVVAGAIKVAAEKGLADIPDAAIGDMAGLAVEGAEALYDAAGGKCTMTETLDKMGRAGVAAGCRYCAGVLKGYLLSTRFGPLLVDLLGGLLDHMESPRFAENVYTVIHDAAIATWEGLKESVGRKVGNMINVLSN